MRKHVILIALAVFSIVILLSQNNINQVFAIVTWNTSFATDPTSVVYSTHFSRWVVIHTGGIIDTINPVTHAKNTITLPTSTRTYQPSISCPNTTAYCIVVQDGTTSNDRVLTLNPITGSIITNTTTGISGLSTVQNGNTVTPNGYIIGICTVGSARVARSVDGIQFGVCGGSTMGAQNIVYSVTGTTTTYFGNDGASGIQIWDNTAFTLTCSVALSVGSAGEGEFYNSNYYIEVSTTTINKYSQSCGAGTGITGTGLTTQLHGIKVNTARNEMYVISTTTVAVMNLTSTNISTLLYSIDIGTNIGSGRVVFDVNLAGEQVAGSSTTGNGFLYGANLNDANDGSGGEQVTSGTSGGVCLNVDANGDGKINLLDCLNSGGALAGLLPANQNITTVGTTIGQGIGLIDPNNENPRTNGVGLFYMLIVGTFFAIALMTTVHTLHMRGFISASVREIDPIFWLFLVVGTVSVSWYLDWIDDIIFAAMTVGLAGLVAFGVLKHFGRI